MFPALLIMTCSSASSNPSHLPNLVQDLLQGYISSIGMGRSRVSMYQTLSFVLRHPIRVVRLSDYVFKCKHTTLTDHSVLTFSAIYTLSHSCQLRKACLVRCPTHKRLQRQAGFKEENMLGNRALKYRAMRVRAEAEGSEWSIIEIWYVRFFC